VNTQKSNAELVYGISDGRLTFRVYSLDSSGRRTSEWSEHTFNVAAAEEHVAQCVRHIAAIKSLSPTPTERIAHEQGD